jgi:PAS domain S-box-containing protein
LSHFEVSDILNSLLNEVAVVGMDFRITEANRHYAEAHNLDPKDVIGKHCYELSEDLRHPCDHSKPSCPIVLAFHTGKSVTAEHTYQKRSRVKHVEIQAIPLKDPYGNVVKVMMILHDITASRMVHTELRRTLHGADQIFSEGDYGILQLGRENRIEWANQTAAELLGYSSSNLLGRDFQIFLDENDRKYFLDPNFAPFSDENHPIWIDMTLIRRDGRKHSCEISSWNGTTLDGRTVTFVRLRDLLAGRRLENKLVSAYWMLSNLLDISSDGVVAADMKGNVILFNKGAENLMGYRAEELIGKADVRQLYPEGVAQEIMKHLRSDKFGGKGRLLPTQFTCISRSGQHIPILISGALIYQNDRELASVGFLYDLRENLKVRYELQESETKFRNLFESIQHGAFFMSLDGKFLDCNRALVSMLGYAGKEELLAVDIPQAVFVHAADSGEVQRRVDEHGGVKDFEVEFRKKNGGLITVLLTVTGLRDHRLGRITGYQGIISDVTERRLLAQQLLQSEKMANLGKLAAGVAHEINNPLGAIYVFAHLLLEKTPADSPGRAHMERIVREASRCKEIVQGLLKFSRQSEPRFLPTSLNGVIRSVLDLFKQQAIFQNIDIREEYDEDLPRVIADPPQLEQVFTNIIFNAAEAMSGSGLILLRTRRSEDGTAVEASVADNGPGIPEKHLENIFEPFFTTKDPSSTESGTGLGLAISYGIVQRHKGTITVTTQLGKGTTFTVHLPIQGT